MGPDAPLGYRAHWLINHLNAGRPIMVEWGDWDGHWQDGYYYYPLEHWFYMCKDRSVAPKPYQLQPFIQVDRKITLLNRNGYP